jgi:protocatechuate 3,4-dioxygenase beta subunit
MKSGALALLLLAPAALAQTGATIEGTVTDSATHGGIAGVAVIFSTGETDRYSAATDSSGNFRITGVEPGEYSTSYVKSGFVRLYLPLPGQSPVRVGVSGTARADAELAAHATLRGRVLDPEGKPATNTYLQLGTSAAETDAEGRFVLQEVPPGTYTLRAVRQTSANLKALAGIEPASVAIAPTYYPSTLNEAEAEHIVVRGGADLAGYEIRLRTSSLYSVRGVVLDAAGKPLAKARVHLYSPGEERLLGGKGSFGTQIEYYLNLHGILQARTTISHTDGTFQFANIFPGDWSLTAEWYVAGESLDSAASVIVPVRVSDQDVKNLELRCTPDFTVRFTADAVTAGTRVSLQEGGAESVQLTVTHWPE